MRPSIVDVMQRPCTKCGKPTFMSDSVCRRCDGTAVCRRCGGFGEHFDSCRIGQAIATARWKIARAGATR